MHDRVAGMDDSNANVPMNIHDDCNVSLAISNLGDSDRSGPDISDRGESTRTRLSTITDHNYDANMDEEERKEDGSRREVPIATPASSHAHNVSLSSRMTSAIPPLPLPANANVNAAAANQISPADDANPISPATPMGPPVSIANLSIDTPGSAQSRDSRTLAALYHVSRRSRTNTPRSSGTNTPMPPAPVTFHLPPPLYAAPPTAKAASIGEPTMNSEVGASGASRDNTVAGTDDPHKVSLQSSSNSSSFLHESWNTSMGSLMNTGSFRGSMLNTSFRPSLDPNVNNRPSIEYQHLPTAADTDSAEARAESASRVPAPSGPGERSDSQLHERPNLMDYKIEDRTSWRGLSSSEQCESHDHNATAATALPPSASTGGSGTQSLQLRMKIYRVESMDEDDDANPPSAHLAVPSLSVDSTDANGKVPSPAAGCAEQLSSLQVRTREEFELHQGIGGTVHEGGGESALKDASKDFGKKSDAASSSEDDEGETDSKEPPMKKKKKMKSHASQSEDYFLTPMTQKSCISSASFDLIAQPSSRVSSIQHELSPGVHDIDVAEFLRTPVDIDIADLHEVNAEIDHEMGVQRMGAQNQQEQVMDSKIPADEAPDDKMHHDQEPKQIQEELKQNTPSEKDQRILRRKIQRLLLIRHCSTCPIPIPPLLPPHTVTVKSDTPGNPGEGSDEHRYVVCHVTSHCAEGKALCAHIRTCKRKNCKYKRCMTSREVLGHYKNCRDRSCEICGPVKTMKRKKGKGQGGHHKQRKRSDSSIETIDDEGWLVANMMATKHPVSGNPEQVESSRDALHPEPTAGDS